MLDFCFGFNFVLFCIGYICCFYYDLLKVSRDFVICVLIKDLIKLELDIEVLEWKRYDYFFYLFIRIWIG